MNSAPAAARQVRVAVDVGGTTFKGAVFLDDGTLLCRKTTSTFQIPGDAFAGLRALIADLVQAARGGGYGLAGIGISTPGLVDAARGKVVYAANLGWSDFSLRDTLADEFGVPVGIEHDARSGAIAERAAHADVPVAYDNFIFVPIGTGVAAAVVTSGMLVRGAAGGAGEFGHMPIMPSGERCSCGQRGCIEAYASAATVFARYRARGGSRARSTPELIETLAADADAAAVWSELVEALALGLASLTAVLDPELIVIGGGLSKAGDHLLGPLREGLESKLGWRATPIVEQSALGSHAGLVGAAIIAAEQPVGASFARVATTELEGSDRAPTGSAEATR